MRKFFFFMMLFSTCVVMAQNEAQTATLQTGDNVQVFNGYYAFQDAYNAAENGSVITLTGGTFYAARTKITKNVSIYGNGFEDNEAKGIHRTEFYMNYQFLEFGNDDNSIQNIVFEGIYVGSYIQINNVTNMIISKCYMENIEILRNVNALAVRQCCILRNVIGGDPVQSVDFQNCHISGGNMYYNVNTPIHFDHCIIKGGYNRMGVYTNCILGTSFNGEYKSTVQGCICSFDEQEANIHYGNWYDVDFNTLFADDTSIDYAPEKTFQLKFPDAYIGTDGTQVGINGGKYPWNKIPSTPFVKDLQVQVNGTTLNVTYEAQVR